MILVGKSVPLNPDRSSRANHSANSSSRGSLEFNLFLDHHDTAGNNEEDESSSLYGSLPDNDDDHDALSSSVVPSSALRKNHHHHSHSSSVDRYSPNGNSKSYSVVTVKAMNRSDLNNNKKYSKYQLQAGSSDHRIITDSLTSDGSIVSASSSSMLIFNDSQSLEPLSNSMMVDATVTAIEGTYINTSSLCLSVSHQELHSITHLHSTAPIFTHLHSTAPIFTHLHSTAPIFTHLHSTAPIFTHLHSTAPIFTHLHSTAPISAAKKATRQRSNDRRY